MISFTKPSKFLYPVRWVYFADDPSALPAIHPWEIVVCKQASEAVKEAVKDQAVFVQEFHTLLTDLTQPLDALWKRMNKTRRNNITQISDAVDLPLDIAINELSVDEFYEHYCTFSRQKRFGKPNYCALKTIVRYCDVIHASYQGKCCAISSNLRDGTSRVRGIHSISNIDPVIPGQLRSRINARLNWWEMQYYKEQGVAIYDWGGIFTDPHSPSYGITAFKESFGGERHQEWDIILAGSMLKPLSKSILRRFAH